MKKQFIISFCCLLVLFFIVSCGEGAKKAEAEGPIHISNDDSASLKIALLSVDDCVPFYYAYESGIYDSLSLPVKFYTFYSQMDADTTIQRNHVDGSFSDLPRALFEAGKGIPIQIIKQTSGAWQIIASKQMRTNKTQQLKGKLVVSSRYSASDYLVYRGLAASKQSYDHVYHPQINDLGIRLQMLLNNQIDAAALPEPQADIAISYGGQSTFSSADDGIKLGCLIFNNKSLANLNKSNQIHLLIRGYNLAVDELNKKHSNLVDSIYINTFKLEETQVKRLKGRKFSHLNEVNPKDVSLVAKWLTMRNVLTTKFNIQTIINNRFPSK